MDFEKIFDLISKQMLADFEKARASVPHSGEKGRVLEKILKKFLRQYLPQNLDISTGFIVDTKGNSSKQLDIIISDAGKTPIFYQEEEIRTIPVECVFAVIEVKSALDSGEIISCYENMKSIKKLEKLAWKQPLDGFTLTDSLYGQDWEIWPINYFVFSLDSMNLNSVKELMDKINSEEKLSVSNRIDMIGVLDKGVIMNKRKDGFLDALPTPDSELEVRETKKALILFFTLMGVYLFDARLPNFVFREYIKGIKF